MFQDAIEQPYNLLQTPFDKGNVIKKKLEDVILSLPPTVSVTFQKKDKVIANLAKQISFRKKLRNYLLEHVSFEVRALCPHLDIMKK